MTIQAVVSQAQTSIKAAVSAIKSAPAYPVDSQVTQMTSIAYANNIRIETQSAGFVLTFFDLVIDVMVPRNKVQDSMRQLEGIVEAIAAVFTADPTISGTCQTYGGNITATLTTQEISGVLMIGYQITVPGVKL